MRTSGEKVRISHEAERVQSVSYSHIGSFSVLYDVMSLMPTEKTGGIRERLIVCLNFDVFLCIQIKKQISIRGRRHWDYIFVGF